MSARTGVRPSGRGGPRGFRGAFRGLAALLLAAGVSACAGGDGAGGDQAGEEPDVLSVDEQNAADARAAVNAAARVLAAINEGDSALMRDAFLADATVIANSGESADTSGVDAQVTMVGTNAGRFLERIWDPAVSLSPDGAVVEAAYDFYLDGEFSHCGVDTFIVQMTDRGARVAALSYTVDQPPACEMHPAGAPAGG